MMSCPHDVTVASIVPQTVAKLFVHTKIGNALFTMTMRSPKEVLLRPCEAKVCRVKCTTIGSCMDPIKQGVRKAKVDCDLLQGSCLRRQWPVARTGWGLHCRASGAGIGRQRWPPLTAERLSTDSHLCPATPMLSCPLQLSAEGHTSDGTCGLVLGYRQI